MGTWLVRDRVTVARGGRVLVTHRRCNIDLVVIFVYTLLGVNQTLK